MYQKLIITEEEKKRIRNLHENIDDKKYYVDDSKLGGKGVFASKDLQKGERIGKLHTIIVMFRDYEFTELGKMHNHNDNPNCHNELIGNERHLVASRNIKKGEELTTDYRLQPDLEQPKSWFKTIKEQQEKMYPEKDGYRTYSPFKNLEYIIVNSNGIDCDNIVYDLVLLGNKGEVKFCKKNSGSYFFSKSDKVVELPLKSGEKPEEIFSNKNKLIHWIKNKIEKVDNKGEIKKFLHNL